MFYTVYKITNLVNNKIYVGVHRTKDLEDNYMGSGVLIKKAIEKYGRDNFIREYIAIFDNPDDMFKMETEIVNEDFIKQNDTYNISIGGKGNFTEVALDRALDRIKWLYENDKNWVIDITKKRIESNYKNNGSIAFKNFLGKNHSDNTKKIIGEKNSVHQKGSKNSQFGTTWVYNDKESIKIKKELLPDYISSGWIKGRKMNY